MLEKELKIEYRTRYAANAILVFCLTCSAVVSFALGGRADNSRQQAALLWVVIFFTAMSGLSRSFVKEEEAGTMRLLRVTCEPGPVFFGKVLFNLILLVSVMCALTILFIVFLNISIKNPALYAAALGLAALSVSFLCTLISAMVAGARLRGTLFPILSFPMLLPVFMIAVELTRLSFDGAPVAANTGQLYFLGAYAAASAIGCSFLFELLYYD